MEINKVAKNMSNLNSSLGESLSNARKKLNITTQHVASELYIKERQIIALENEDFSELPQMTFAKGFAVKYGEYLGLSKDEISYKFDMAYPDELKNRDTASTEVHVQSMGTLNRNTGRKFHFNPILLLSGIAVFALAVFLMKTVNSAEENQQPKSVAEESLSTEEQQKGASIDSSSVGATGSAINIKKSNSTGDD